MDTEHCADFAVAHAAIAHSENISAELGFIEVAEVALGRSWQGNIEAEYMPS
jgi:hypothetical protein